MAERTKDPLDDPVQRKPERAECAEVPSDDSSEWKKEQETNNKQDAMRDDILLIWL